MRRVCSPERSVFLYMHFNAAIQAHEWNFGVAFWDTFPIHHNNQPETTESRQYKYRCLDQIDELDIKNLRVLVDLRGVKGKPRTQRIFAKNITTVGQGDRLSPAIKKEWPGLTTRVPISKIRWCNLIYLISLLSRGGNARNSPHFGNL